MNEIQVKEAEELLAIPTHELKGELAKCLEITATNLIYMAKIWFELERREIDLSDLRSGIGKYLALIANKKILPELVVKFAGNLTLLRSISQMSLGKQQHLLTLNTVPVIMNIEGDTPKVERMMLEHIPAKFIYQVFCENGVRTESDQVLYIAEIPKTEKSVKSPPRLARRVSIDKESKELVISNYSAKMCVVLEVLGEHFGLNLKKVVGYEG